LSAHRCRTLGMPPTTTPLPVDGCTVTTFDRFGDSRG
jgi:hypothetical protein